MGRLAWAACVVAVVAATTVVCASGNELGAAETVGEPVRVSLLSAGGEHGAASKESVSAIRSQTKTYFDFLRKLQRKPVTFGSEDIPTPEMAHGDVQWDVVATTANSDRGARATDGARGSSFRFKAPRATQGGGWHVVSSDEGAAEAKPPAAHAAGGADDEVQQLHTVSLSYGETGNVNGAPTAQDRRLLQRNAKHYGNLAQLMNEDRQAGCDSSKTGGCAESPPTTAAAAPESGADFRFKGSGEPAGAWKEISHDEGAASSKPAPADAAAIGGVGVAGAKDESTHLKTVSLSYTDSGSMEGATAAQNKRLLQRNAKHYDNLARLMDEERKAGCDSSKQSGCGGASTSSSTEPAPAELSPQAEQRFKRMESQLRSMLRGASRAYGHASPVVGMAIAGSAQPASLLEIKQEEEPAEAEQETSQGEAGANDQLENQAEQQAEAQEEAQVDAEAQAKAQAEEQAKAEADAKQEEEAMEQAKADAKAKLEAEEAEKERIREEATAQAKEELEAKQAEEEQMLAEAQAEAEAVSAASELEAETNATESNTTVVESNSTSPEGNDAATDADADADADADSDADANVDGDAGADATPKDSANPEDTQKGTEATQDKGEGKEEAAEDAAAEAEGAVRADDDAALASGGESKRLPASNFEEAAAGNISSVQNKTAFELRVEGLKEKIKILEASCQTSKEFLINATEAWAEERDKVVEKLADVQTTILGAEEDEQSTGGEDVLDSVTTSLNVTRQSLQLRPKISALRKVKDAATRTSESTCGKAKAAQDEVKSLYHARLAQSTASLTQVKSRVQAVQAEYGKWLAAASRVSRAAELAQDAGGSPSKIAANILASQHVTRAALAAKHYLDALKQQQQKIRARVDATLEELGMPPLDGPQPSSEDEVPAPEPWNTPDLQTLASDMLVAGKEADEHIKKIDAEVEPEEEVAQSESR